MPHCSTGDRAYYRLGMIGAVLTGVGIIFSGPVAMLLVGAVQAQPAWQDAGEFVANYHWVQSLTFYFGMLLVAGSMQMLTAIYLLGRRACGLLALVIASIAAALIFFNYFVQVMFLPGLARDYSPGYDPLISALSMSNPVALTWALEMGGYGLLGLATWLAAGYFRQQGIERAAFLVFVINGILSLGGALWTSIEPGWVLSLPGLIAFAAWNSLYLALTILVFLVLRRRLRLSSSGPNEHEA